MRMNLVALRAPSAAPPFVVEAMTKLGYLIKRSAAEQIRQRDRQDDHLGRCGFAAERSMVIMAAPDPHKTRLITPLFKLGQIVSTPGAREALSQPGTDWMALLMRHSTGDWGDLDAEDNRANDDVVMNGDRILSAYNLSTGARIWIITEADRSATRFLLPEAWERRM
jgi:hypothetical protein